MREDRPHTMRALVKDGDGLRVRRVPRPRLRGADGVLIRVAATGICRTDVYVAEGRIPSRSPVILGHEFSGVVRGVGPGVTRARPGDHVTALPWLACGDCAECRRANGAITRCLRGRMIGVDCDGAFAEWILLPAAVVFPLPPSLPFPTGAYVEPVAASLAVLKANLCPAARGLLYGGSRIAILTRKILASCGFRDVTLFDPEKGAHELQAGEYDWAIETVATTQSLHDLVRAVRPGGKIVLKSRPYQLAGLDVRAAVLKELTLQAVNYGSFEEAIALLVEGRIDVADLLGPVYPLEEWERAFAESGAGEAAKCFLTLLDEIVSPA